MSQEIPWSALVFGPLAIITVIFEARLNLQRSSFRNSYAFLSLIIWITGIVQLVIVSCRGYGPEQYMLYWAMIVVLCPLPDWMLIWYHYLRQRKSRSESIVLTAFMVLMHVSFGFEFILPFLQLGLLLNHGATIICLYAPACWRLYANKSQGKG
mgnify:CR=1 FL=1